MKALSSYYDTYFERPTPGRLVFFPGATWACFFWNAGYEVPVGEDGRLRAMLKLHDAIRAVVIAGYLAALFLVPDRRWPATVLVVAAAVVMEVWFYVATRRAVSGLPAAPERRDGGKYLRAMTTQQEEQPAWRNFAWAAITIGLALVGALAGLASGMPGTAMLAVLGFGGLAWAMVTALKGQSLRRRNAELERLIAQRTAELERVNRHKSEFLANMSHELRTPLNAIIGFSDVMLSGMVGAIPDKQKEFVGDIRDSGRHLLALINDILDLSKVEAGRMELQRAPFDLERANAEAITLVRGRAEGHGIELRIEVEPGIGTIDADERKFKQILVNLLSNAVKFTPHGGVVTLATQRVDDAVRVSVADTGVGICAEDQGAIFQEFRQVGNDPERRAEGTGLGLALTKRLVELHGGSIRVESAPGQGSTFTFELPVRAT